MIDWDAQLVTDFPIWSIEDCLAGDDWDGWTTLTARLGERVQLVGDDNFVTHPAIIADAITRHVANAALITVNQIGTVTETLEAMRVCREAGYAAMVSHRSGETEDTFIADLTAGSGCGQLKTGAPPAANASPSTTASSRSPTPTQTSRTGSGSNTPGRPPEAARRWPVRVLGPDPTDHCQLVEV
jgi:enolase